MVGDQTIILTLRFATRKGGSFMFDIGVISAGNDDNKKSLSPVFKRVGKTIIILTPVLLFSNAALAVDTTKCTEYQFVVELPEAIQSIKKTGKVHKALENVRKVAGYQASYGVCKNAFDRTFAHIGVEGTPLSVALWSILMLACGSLLTIHVLGDE